MEAIPSERERLKHRDLEVLGARCVGEVENLILNRKLDEYEFNDDSFGYRYWQ